MTQVVQSSTHTGGQLTYVVVVRSGLTVLSVNVPPPVLSDHSMIDDTLQLRRTSHYESMFRSCRAWRSFDYDKFARDLQQSALICTPATMWTISSTSTMKHCRRCWTLTRHYDAFAGHFVRPRCGTTLSVI